jgi:hypothetical protein
MDQSSVNNGAWCPECGKYRSNLRADCKNCFGLCCVALYFSASEGFPIDKDAGQPCLNLHKVTFFAHSPNAMELIQEDNLFQRVRSTN